MTRKQIYQYEYNRRPEVKLRYKLRQRERTEYKKNHSLKRYYGISLSDYNILLAKQDFRCAICKKHTSEGYHPLAVDHCHKTGKVRGLLCTGCNVRLGTLEDEAFKLVATAYLAETLDKIQ